MDSTIAKRSYTRRAFVGELTFIASAATLLAGGMNVDAATRVPHIGFLVGSEFYTLTNAFLDELRAKGFVDGQNVSVEKGDTGEMARSLARMNLDFIVAGALTYAIEVRNANPNMPMVIATCPGMVSNGFARSLEHPGGKYTGMDELPPGVTAKRLTLLKTAVPAAKRIALLSTTPGIGGYETQVEDAERAAKQLGVTVKPYRAATPDELDRALTGIAGDRMDGMLNFQGGLSLARRQAIVDFATQHRLPAIYQATMFAEVGGLMAWAPDLVEQYREAARLAALILRGAKPGDLAVKRPAKYYLTINAGAAKKMGLALPPALLAEATRVIE
jgi:putative ABC transport system substrate-binding protein